MSFPLRTWLPTCGFGEGRKEGKGKEKELGSRRMTLTEQYESNSGGREYLLLKFWGETGGTLLWIGKGKTKHQKDF